MQKSFIEKLQDVNHGKRGMYIAIGTLAIVVLVKLFITPMLEPHYAEPAWTLFRNVVNAVETIALVNIMAFFVCIYFLREKVGHKIIYAMQLRDTSYFNEKWILFWIRSIWICFGVLAVTTVIKQALFKSWGSFFFLMLLFCLPFFIMPRLRRRM